MKLKIEYKKLEDLAPYELNSRTHSEDQIVQIASKSLDLQTLFY